MPHVSPPKGPAQATLEFVEKENGQYGITINYFGGTVDTETLSLLYTL